MSDTESTPEIDPTLAATGVQTDLPEEDSKFDGLTVPEAEQPETAAPADEPKEEGAGDAESEPKAEEVPQGEESEDKTKEEGAPASEQGEGFEPGSTPDAQGAPESSTASGAAIPDAQLPEAAEPAGVKPDPAAAFDAPVEATDAPTEVTPKEEEPAKEEEPKGEEPAGESDKSEEVKEGPVATAPINPSVDAPKIVEQGTPADMATLSPSTSISSTFCQVQVGDDHVAQGISAQSVGQAKASYSIFGESFADWLQSQGLIPWAAPQLSAFAADKHGADAKLSGSHWSLVVTEFYSQS